MHNDKEALILQHLLQDISLDWQVYNCKILKQQICQDSPLSFLNHYDSLSDELKAAHPLNVSLLKHMNTAMSIAQAAAVLGIEQAHFAKPWHIKYVGAFVVTCQPLLLALRIHFSNTAKNAQTVNLPNPTHAWQQECHAWRCFGVVDVLHKGEHTLYSSYDGDDNPLCIYPSPMYQALPSTHSLSITQLISEYKEQLSWLNHTLLEHLSAQVA